MSGRYPTIPYINRITNLLLEAKADAPLSQEVICRQSGVVVLYRKRRTPRDSTLTYSPWGLTFSDVTLMRHYHGKFENLLLILKLSLQLCQACDVTKSSLLYLSVDLLNAVLGCISCSTTLCLLSSISSTLSLLEDAAV